MQISRVSAIWGLLINIEVNGGTVGIL